MAWIRCMKVILCNSTSHCRWWRFMWFYWKLYSIHIALYIKSDHVSVSLIDNGDDHHLSLQCTYKVLRSELWRNGSPLLPAIAILLYGTRLDTSIEQQKPVRLQIKTEGGKTFIYSTRQTVAAYFADTVVIVMASGVIGPCY